MEWRQSCELGSAPSDCPSVSSLLPRPFRRAASPRPALSRAQAQRPLPGVGAPGSDPGLGGGVGRGLGPCGRGRGIPECDGGPGSLKAWRRSRGWGGPRGDPRGAGHLSEKFSREGRLTVFRDSFCPPVQRLQRRRVKSFLSQPRRFAKPGRWSSSPVRVRAASGGPIRNLFLTLPGSLKVYGCTYVPLYLYLWLIHIDVWQRPRQYCKASIL